MQIFVRTFGSTFSVDLCENATLNDLQEAIENVEFVPKNLQRIEKDSSALSAGILNLSEADTVTLTLGMEGGLPMEGEKAQPKFILLPKEPIRIVYTKSSTEYWKIAKKTMEKKNIKM